MDPGSVPREKMNSHVQTILVQVYFNARGQKQEFVFISFLFVTINLTVSHGKMNCFVTYKDNAQ